MRHIADRFAWYDELVRDAGGAPLITAEILDRMYYAAEPPADHEFYLTSGTSTGRRRSISYSHADQERYLEVKANVFRAFAATRRNSVQRVASDVGTGHAASTAAEVFRRLGLEHDDILFDRPIAEHLAILRARRPQLLYTMPSILESLVQSVPDPREFGIEAVILVGESVGPEWIANVAARRLGIPESDVMDTYGSIEIGLIAYYSHEKGRYVAVDGIVAEAIAPAAVGLDTVLDEDESVLVVTSLDRETFPAVRYVTYDVVRGFRAGGDGEPATFEAITRRIGAELKHGEKISLHDIEAVVYRHLADAIVRVRAEGRRIRVAISSDALGPELRARINDEIEESIPEIGVMIANGILDRVEVEPTPFDRLPVDPTRPKQRFIR